MEEIILTVEHVLKLILIDRFVNGVMIYFEDIFHYISYSNVRRKGE